MSSAAGLTFRLQTLVKLKRSVIMFLFEKHTFVSPSADSRGAVVSYWQKYVHEVLVNRLGSLSMPRKSEVKLTDRPDMTLDVYRGRKTTIQQHLFENARFLYRKAVHFLARQEIKNSYMTCSLVYKG